MKYACFDHTADIGLHIFGKDPNRLFENAAEALFSLIAEVPKARPSEQVALLVAGDSLEALFMGWLRELLLLFTLKERLVLKAKVTGLSETALSATLQLLPYDPAIHELKNEIKAVTYHGLVVEKRGDGWFAQVIFDV